MKQVLHLCAILDYSRGMDFVHPVESVIPGAQGRILGVLARTTAELNLRTVARLARVSVAQASRVLPRLVELGIVERREAPPSTLFLLARGNRVAEGIVALADLRSLLLEDLRTAARLIRPRPASLTLFGSMARGEARAGSDMDVLVVRPKRVGAEHSGWEESVRRWVECAEVSSGNHVSLIEVSEDEVSGLLSAGSGVWSAAAREGVVLAGRPLPDVGVASVA
ncbi:MAG: nucleotidyltransferase domain-containing protein [Actinomycetota bacterium]